MGKGWGATVCMKHEIDVIAKPGEEVMALNYRKRPAQWERCEVRKVRAEWAHWLPQEEFRVKYECMTIWGYPIVVSSDNVRLCQLEDMF